MKHRILLPYLRQKIASKFGRLIALTGARQTGKTTLIRAGFPDYPYISLEDPVTRPDFAALSAAQWHHQYPVAILDEVQKLPSLIESIKATGDLYPDTSYILLGSSQILLLEKIRESLAGRVSLVELYPLTFPEMLTISWEDSAQESKMVRWLKSGTPADFFSGIPRSEKGYAQVSRLLEEYLQFGAMPALADPALHAEEKYGWLRDYIQTYLQRDVRDLANLRELEPFVRAQKTLAGLTGQLLNTAELARAAGIAHATARRFVNYLELSYQVVLLSPWFRNPGKRLAKTPKVHFLDPGVQRALLARRGAVTGNEFESAIIAEIYKQLKTSRLPVEFYHLHTADGRQVDLLLELEEGFVPIEIKMSERVSPADARHLRELSVILDKPVLHALVLSNDGRLLSLGEKITAAPVAWFLGG
ncbi:MAG: ATP-binding protein [Candidatus Latescibacteria bacterium]|nr:ATP-binding protein [Candidatus Latescibacterota bacterium]